jgi:hypothetical protein
VLKPVNAARRPVRCSQRASPSRTTKIDSHNDRAAREPHPRSISISGVATSMTPVSKYTIPPVGRW